MFNFDPSRKFEIITISPQQLFFTTFITNVEKLISFIRQEFSLNISTVKRDKATFQEDLLKNHPLGKILLDIHQAAQTSQGQRTKSKLSFEQFNEITNFVSSATNYHKIKHIVDELNQIIIKDIKTAERGGPNFNYCDIDCNTAREILTDLLNNNSDNTSTGVILWRVCLSIKREHGHAFVMNNADIIKKLRQVSSFQSHEPIDDSNLTILAIENPWMFAFFTKKQLIDLFICSKDALEILKKKLGLRSINNSSNEDIELDNSLFSSEKNDFGKEMHLPVLEEQEQLKKALVNFLVGAAVYTRNVINDTVSSRQFLSINGFYREFVPYLYPATIIKLFCELDTHTHERARKLRVEIEKAGVEKVKIDAQRMRGCIEFKWLLTRIEDDLKSGTDPIEYFRQNKEDLKIPYLLYELVSRGILQLPLPILLALFKAINPDVILESLQLFDTDDLVHNYIEIGDAKDQYYVDKSNPTSFHRLMHLLLTDEFKALRLSWLNDQNKLALLLTYPVLLKGVCYIQMQRLMTEHHSIVMSNAEIGLKKTDFNPFVICPLLLAYLPAQHMKFIYAIPSVRKLCINKLLPPEVILHYVKSNTLDIVKTEIPEIESYLDLDLFTKADKASLDKQLLLAMLANDKYKIVLKHYPSILNTFDLVVVRACMNDADESDAIFMRHIARQAVLIELILADFDQLISNEHLTLFKRIIEILYCNPETNALVKKIEDELQVERETLSRNYDEVKDCLLIAKAQKKLEFTARPYRSNIKFPEHDSQAHIDDMLMSKTIMADPIVFLLEDMINAFPHWAYRFVQSPGFYPVLNHYCIQVLHVAGDNIKRELDQCFALFQYASLFIKLEEYENAANLLNEYLLLVGINISIQNYYDTAFYLFINCAEHLSESKPLETLKYYKHAAELLLHAEEINIVCSKKHTLVKNYRFKLLMSIELAKKAIVLIQKQNILKDKWLDLITILRVLLTRGVPLINLSSPDISRDAFEHQNVLNALMNYLKVDSNKQPLLHTDAELLQIFNRINHHLIAVEREDFAALERDKNNLTEGNRNSEEKKLMVSKKIVQFSGYTHVKIEKELLELTHNYTLALRKQHYSKRKNKLSDIKTSGTNETYKASLPEKHQELQKISAIAPFLERLKTARVSFNRDSKSGDKEEELKLKNEREEMYAKVQMVISDNDNESDDNETIDAEKAAEYAAVLAQNQAMHAEIFTERQTEQPIPQENINTEQQVVQNTVVDNHIQNSRGFGIVEKQSDNVESPVMNLKINQTTEKAVEIEAEEKRKLQEELEKAEEKRKLQEDIKKAKEKESARNKKREEEERKRKREEDKRKEDALALQSKNREEERIRLQAIEEARKEKELLVLQKKIEQDALDKKIAEEKRKKTDEDAKVKKEQELQRRKEEELKRNKLEEEKSRKEIEENEAHKKRLQEFKQKILEDERKKKIAEEERIKGIELKRIQREERARELQQAPELNANQIKIAQEEQRLLAEERRLDKEEHELLEEMNKLNSVFPNNDSKRAKPEDPKKVKSKEIGKDLLQTIASNSSGNKAFDVARKRSESVPVQPVSLVCNAGFFAKPAALQMSTAMDGSSPPSVKDSASEGAKVKVSSVKQAIAAAERNGAVSHEKFQRSKSVGRVETNHPQPALDTRDDSITLGSSSRPNRFAN